MKQKKVQDWGAWIGLYRKPDNASYWIDDTPLTGQYAAWADGEPNNDYEKCVHTYTGKLTNSNQVGKWNDRVCNLPQSYMASAPVVLCQRKYI